MPSRGSEHHSTPERDILRLLVISSDTYPPTRVDVSVLYGEELAGLGHRIDWILQSEAACSSAYQTPWGGGTAWVGPTDLGTSLFNRIRKHVRGILHDLKVFALARRGAYDIIQVKDKFISGLFGALAARLFGARFVYWLSYPFPEAYLFAARDGTARYPFLYRIRGTAFKIILYRILLRLADHVFVQSEQMRRDVGAHGVPLTKMTAVPMGISLEQFSGGVSALTRRVIPEGEPAFMYLGTLIKVRRLDFLVRVLSHVRAEIPGATLYFVGRGEDAGDERLLKDEAGKLGLLDAMKLIGQLPRPQALQYVAEADVCVSPFFPTPILNSTSPTKLVEYMAMGKAVVANDHPEQRLLIGESGCGYCTPWDEKLFADAIVRLLCDPQTAREMGERGRRYAAAHRDYRSIAANVSRQLLEVRGARRGTEQKVL